MSKLGVWRWPVAGVTLLIVAAFMVPSAIGRQPAAANHPFAAHGALASHSLQCPAPYSSVRDPANPLMLPTPPGANPLNGAQFWVPGPLKGPAAAAIATLLGISPTLFPPDYSWARFQDLISHGALLARLQADPALMRDVVLLAKVASEPQANRISISSGGGGPGAIFGQVQKILCRNLTSDPGTIPILTTYFMHPVAGGCPTPADMVAMSPEFRRRVDEMAAGIGTRPAVVLVELDGIGSSVCVQSQGSMPQWEADLRYEAMAFQALPHTVVYLEGGYSDSNSPRYTARVLNAAGVRQIRGFWTDDTHAAWTINEARWGEKVSQMTGGAHFVINTAGNGHGPRLNPHPITQGIENRCNPQGGLGPRPTSNTGLPYVDAFLWSSLPGSSSGHCKGGPPAGAWTAAGAMQLASNANDKLGPGFANNPY